MASLDQSEEDISTKVLQYLSQTPYACSSLSRLMTREDNFVYRGALTHPLSLQDGGAAESVIIKHSTATTYQVFEETLLKSLINLATRSTESTIVKAPGVYIFDRDANIQVLEDLADTDGLKTILLSPDAELKLPSPKVLGHSLGKWLRSFHAWALAPEQAAVRSKMGQNDPMRKLKYSYTFGTVLEVLGDHPSILDGNMKTLQSIQDVVIKDFERPATEGEEHWGLIHGDLWSGNMLLPKTPWKEVLSPSDELNRLFIIDWEFAQFGHRSYDLGQIVGDLYERKVVNKNDIVIPVMEGVIKGYGELSDDMAFRTAMYVGVHLISWDTRRPRQGPRVAAPEVIANTLTIGRDFILNAWRKDREFFRGSALSSLFSMN
ncbi:hypothetical protein E8E14_011172 [Neopestalotiopsis sp. 37M]|nr:hypothetical protein E8E14_011172 [Neopestalotiopsis sp. 37M]